MPLAKEVTRNQFNCEQFALRPVVYDPKGRVIAAATEYAEIWETRQSPHRSEPRWQGHRPGILSELVRTRLADFVVSSRSYESHREK